jgi:hypothetical protein
MRSLVLSVLFTLMGSQLALAGSANHVTPVSVPTLGEWGMIAMFIILGIVGVVVLRKRLASQS